MKLKILMPAVSVITAGSVSYPYLFSTGSSGVSSSNSPSLNLNESNFNNSRSLTDIHSGKASALSVSPLDASKNPSLEIQSDSPGINLDTKGEIMQANTLQVANLQNELSRENNLGKLSEEQIQELKSAFEYVQNAKQAFQGLIKKVDEYRNTSASRGDTSSTRTFLESGKQYLTKKHRESLLQFFEIYSKLRDYRDKSLSKIDLINKGVTNFSGVLALNAEKVGSETIINALKEIHWDKKEMKIFKNISNENDWGWGDWRDNPFGLFYSDSNVWWKKVIRIKDALDVSKLNNRDKQKCSTDISGTNTERSQYIKAWCDEDYDRFKKLIEGYKSEIELDIASWLLDQMEMILNEEKIIG